MKQLCICLMAVLLAAQCAAGHPPTNSEEIELNSYVTDETPGNYYKIDLAENTEYNVEMVSVPEEMNTWIRILDAEGYEVAGEQHAVPGDLFSLTFETDEAGTYYVGIIELEGKSCGPYTFLVKGSSEKLWIR